MQKDSHKKIPTYHHTCLYLLATLVMMLGCTQSHKASQKLETKGMVNIKEADKDWEALKKAIPMFRDKKEYAVYTALPRLAMTQFEDRHARQKINLAATFWETYPADTRGDTARTIFITATPYFVLKHIPDSLQSVLAAIPRKEGLKFIRKLPIDFQAMEQWIQKGNAMVEEVLASNSSIETKEYAEWTLFGRDFKKAARYFGWLQQREDKSQQPTYWPLIESQYWAVMKLRLDANIKKYADMPILADRAKDFLSSLKSYAPKMAESYWQELYNNHAGSEQAGIQAVYKAAEEQLDALVVESGAKPLEMVFTSMDGRKVDLAKMRGKVILIDFWATWCAPCVKEIPHLKKLYNKYHEQGFEIIGITLDEKAAEARVQKLIKNKEVPWPQRFEGKGFNGDAYKQLYGIGSLPTVWLVNKEGIIVDRNARGERLEPLIRKYLDK
ncbi:TlpA disulfide reductase family protein [uncultured Polaribacter sp.]|uniref:TlpA family protein disulfide reductase n=1 Tax=uncultured Polaribacter sp. TaxID=174711 RepID=UPI002627B48D|nr:TlpA disulfide reductase family protein [uncultured Polaribacter sp.]